MITINKNNLQALLNGVAKDKIRTNLCAVYFDIDKSLAVVTDGHCLMSCPIVVENERMSALVSAESIKTLLAVVKAQHKNVIDLQINTPMDLKYTCMGVPLEVVNATFPQYEAVIPDIDTRQIQITLSSIILEKLIKFAKESNPGVKANPITFCLSDNPIKPALVYSGKNQCVAMLMRMEQITKEKE